MTDEELVMAIESLPACCSLDVAEDHHDGLGRVAVAELLRVSRQAIETIEKAALEKLGRRGSKIPFGVHCPVFAGQPAAR